MVNPHHHRSLIIPNIQTGMQEMKTDILFVHAISGRDTCSAIYRKGKKRVYDLVKKNSMIAAKVKVFSNNEATQQQLRRVGEQFLFELYGGEDCASLDKYCYYVSITNKSLTAKFELATLPPLSAPTTQHVYLA